MSLIKDLLNTLQVYSLIFRPFSKLFLPLNLTEEFRLSSQIIAHFLTYSSQIGMTQRILIRIIKFGLPTVNM